MRRDAQEDKLRASVLEEIRGISSAEYQLEYERSVPIADVPAEMICGFCDELFHPTSKPFLGAFTAAETRDLAELHGRMCAASEAFVRDNARTVSEILKVPEWRRTMDFARRLLVRLMGDG